MVWMSAILSKKIGKSMFYLLTASYQRIDNIFLSYFANIW
jgi:hypothetical protein